MSGEILRVCECCHFVMDEDDKPTGKKWDGKEKASHGRCAHCVRGAEIFGNDNWIDMTESERR